MKRQIRVPREAGYIAFLLLAAGGVAVGLDYPETGNEQGPSGRGYGDRAGTGFINWETPQVHSLELTPDRTKLLACNTADNRLEVFDLTSGSPVAIGSIPVGLDPVSVRAISNTEAWVVNHISDSVSVVDLTTMNVRWTLATLDEPWDVVFSGGTGSPAPRKAFVSTGTFNTVQVFEPTNLTLAPVNVAVDAENPRALAVSPDGTKVYAAIFESGNGSTILGGGSASSTGAMRLAFPPNVVSDPAGPYGGVNPPPNSGATFSPPINPAVSTGLPVGMIVKKNAAGRWMDDNGGDWTDVVSGANAAKSGRKPGWDLPDRDVAVINASSLSVSYANRLMNICMGLGVNPATGDVTVVGTDGINEVRFEPNVNGTFVRVELATVNPLSLAGTVTDLNPHLNYASSTISQPNRDKSVGDPRSIVWNATGTIGYVSGMGSNNVVVITPSGARATGGGGPTEIEVGEGPTGLALDGPRSQLYVQNRFGGSISVIDTASRTEVTRVGYFDPTPPAITVGRKHLYDTHKNSGLGQSSCASCHVDGKMDRLAWDLGDPTGTRAPLTGLNLGFGTPGLAASLPSFLAVPFETFHPMKGPMTTQTMQDIIGHEPLHWRGDRFGLEAFNGAFIGLQGDDTNLSASEMQEFENFLATITYPPNPFRNFDNTLSTSVPLPGHLTTGRFAAAGAQLPNGNAQAGLNLYRGVSGRRLDSNAFTCVACHTLPTGGGPDGAFTGSVFAPVFSPIPAGPNGERHIGVVSVDGSTNVTIKVPQLRNQYKKRGFNAIQTSNRAGFGVLHDGSVDSLERFVSEPVFNVNSDQEVANLVAFLFSLTGSELPVGSTTNVQEPPGPLSKDSHAAVGKQTTLVNLATASITQIQFMNQMTNVADTGKVGLVAKGLNAGNKRGWYYTGSGVWQSDKAGQTITTAALRALASPGSEITFTVVPKGTEIRIGADRNSNGILDGDETPPCPCPADFDASGGTPDSTDIDAFFNAWLAGSDSADADCSGGTPDSADINAFFTAWLAGGC
jgi:YVTN family beta-propeller protein